MSKREEIIQLADQLIREKGYNAFSFYDISKKVGIKNASIHYHFPVKSDLGIAVIQLHTKRLQHLIDRTSLDTPIQKLGHFFSIYENIKNENKVCLVGSLATDFNTIDGNIQLHLKTFSEIMLTWVSQFLEDGRQEQIFHFEPSPRTKALMIISNMLAIVQLCRLTNLQDFETVKSTIKQELIKSSPWTE